MPLGRLIGFLILLGPVAGCQDAPAPTDATPETVSESSTTSSTAPAAAPTATASGEVWFPDPLAVIAQDAGLADEPVMIATTATPSVESTEPPAGTSATVSSSNEQSWDALISAELLETEVKAIRNFLNQKLQSVGTYNQAIFELPPHTSTLAVLANVASLHPGEIRWKENSNLIRNVAATMHEEALQRGPKSQRALLASFEMIDSVFTGSPSSEAESAEARDGWDSLAEMGNLMKRIETAFNRMKTDAGNADGFTEEADMVRLESAVLATLMRVITTEDLGYGDDEDFLAHANPLIEACNQIADAVDAGDFDRYDSAMSAITGACASCHTDYKD